MLVDVEDDLGLLLVVEGDSAHWACHPAGLAFPATVIMASPRSWTQHSSKLLLLFELPVLDVAHEILDGLGVAA
jgi:hypothetical protein